LVPNKVGIDLNSRAKGAKEGTARVVFEDEAAAAADEKGLGCGVDLVGDDLAVVNIGGGVLQNREFF